MAALLALAWGLWRADAAGRALEAAPRGGMPRRMVLEGFSEGAGVPRHLAAAMAAWQAAQPGRARA